MIATTLEDALNAESGGADRIELIANRHEGGVTPSMVLVQKVAASIKIPVHVMIRPHSRSFHMLKDDIQKMIA
ncbi:copper homeostasis protein CutC [Paenibacillus sp. yr247]|uniref:copper homeostasis protein CutC n=1 Tax=Paenibacillus sp. yr247 TaxID=1761880 RepID=UPI0020C83C87|nr:copper homeostasis protein CutC [Paenibacillus sp. yr247]